MRALLITGTVALAVALGACGKKGDPKPPASAPAASQTATDDDKKTQE